jgi:hypothetical protein
MTSAGANTFSIELNLNNLESQIATGLTAGVSAIATSGAGLSASGGTGNVTLTNTGVTSLVAGSNITLSGATGAVTVNSTASGGISAVNGGTAISTSTASGVVTVNNTGVTSIVAGTGVTVSGATGAVTVNAIASPVIPSSTTIDIYGLVNITITASQLANCYIYSSQLIPSPFSPNTTYYVNLPSYSDLIAVYGGFAVIPFLVGNCRTATATVRFQGDNSIQLISNLFPPNANLQVQTPQIGSTGYTLAIGYVWRGYCVLDPSNNIALYSFNYINSPLLL